jgi:fatty acid-binding protein DegV
MVEGRVTALEKVRTSAKAVARLVQLTAAAAGDGPVDLAVHHLDAAARAEAVVGQLRAAIPEIGVLHVAELGAVVGAHLGPGVIGTVIVRR